MVVKVGPEIEQLVFEICRRPKQRMIQILASNGADQPFHKWMGQGNIGDGLDLCHLQYSQIGLPLVEPVSGSLSELRYFGNQYCPRMARLNIRHECYTIDGARMNAEPNDPARVLIHDHQDPMGPQRGRLAPE